MAAPTTSKREAALAHVETTLAAVSMGSSYHFTFGEAKRVDGPFFAWLDEIGGNCDAAAFIEAGATAYEPETHSGLYLATVEVFIELAARYEPDSLSPFEQTSDGKDTLRSRLIRDCIVAMMADPLRGGNARDTRVTDDGPVQLDQFNETGQWEPAGWVAHEVRFEVDVEVNEAAP